MEIADNPFSHQRGLMFRDKIDDNSGMVFVFNSPQNLKFWGLNTYVPLDVAFVSNDNIIVKISNIKPLSTKVVASDEDCNMAIETNFNYFAKNKINVGDKIIYKYLTDKVALVSFVKS